MTIPQSIALTITPRGHPQHIGMTSVQSTINHYLKKTEKVNKLGICVPHIFSEKNKEDCIFITTSLLLRQIKDMFLNNIFTSDEKWVIYDSIQRKRHRIDKDESQQPIPKQELHRRIVILCVWWDQGYVIHLVIFKTAVRHLLQTYTLNNCNVCIKVF